MMTSVLGQPSWRFGSNKVTACVTRMGGQLAPVEFRLGSKTVQPFAVAPWAEEPGLEELPAVMQPMRGDFFCLPFGHDENAPKTEQHPPHGETAGRAWNFDSQDETAESVTLRLSLKTEIRPGRVEKRLTLRRDHAAVYCEHVISGMTGEMSLGHHATLKFPAAPGSGTLSFSPWLIGQVFPGAFESPERRGYSFLEPGARFTSLKSVAARTGTVDLSRYPARRGYEDLVMLVTDPAPGFAWTAVTFPELGYVWFALKNPRVLRQTVLWFSNGGRHYPPWNGRHVDVLGLEEVTSYFHTGLGPSVGENHLKAEGHSTSIRLDPRRPLSVRYLMAMQEIPSGFDEVATIDPVEGGVVLRSRSGMSATAPLDPEFITGEESA